MSLPPRFSVMPGLDPRLSGLNFGGQLPPSPACGRGGRAPASRGEGGARRRAQDLEKPALSLSRSAPRGAHPLPPVAVATGPSLSRKRARVILSTSASVTLDAAVTKGSRRQSEN
ncbi:hypothetical protein MTBUT4_1070001 [Magnetospirillum sp. UT-4]|nr:hypothetical protein MTBUT4_1070001 [Magnetospirillum sp. UT-4]